MYACSTWGYRLWAGCIKAITNYVMPLETSITYSNEISHSKLAKIFIIIEWGIFINGNPSFYCITNYRMVLCRVKLVKMDTKFCTQHTYKCFAKQILYTRKVTSTRLFTILPVSATAYNNIQTHPCIPVALLFPTSPSHWALWCHHI